jgi:hypothetical protein
MILQIYLPKRRKEKQFIEIEYSIVHDLYNVHKQISDEKTKKKDSLHRLDTRHFEKKQTYTKSQFSIF